eukprot:scaffold10676_cov129-Isochrysis_galbana.AAC.1
MSTPPICGARSSFDRHGDALHREAHNAVDRRWSVRVSLVVCAVALGSGTSHSAAARAARDGGDARLQCTERRLGWCDARRAEALHRQAVCAGHHLDLRDEGGPDHAQPAAFEMGVP